MVVDTTKCPWCGNSVPQVKFEQIQGRIRAEEKKKQAVAEATLRKEFQEQLKLQVGQEVKKARELERAAADQRAKDQRRKLQAERDAAVQQAKSVELRVTAMKKQMADEAAKRSKKELDQLRRVFEQDREQREIKLKVEYARKLANAEKNVSTLQRQLQEKTANELGDGAELDLYEELRTQCPGDHITRVAKGQRGADIHHEVYYKGQACGKIIYDSKNRQDWKSEYAGKLRADQMEAGAEHAILSTNFFPRREKELCIVDEVIAVSPARVGYVVELLRNSMIRMHVLNLSLQERSGKMAQLYKLISSPAFNERFKEADRLAEDILELDVKEVKAHQAVWKQRGLLAKRLKNMLGEIDTEISAIVERTDANRTRTPTSVVAEFRPSASTLPRN